MRVEKSDRDRILTLKKPFSKKGDSGSLVIDSATNKVVGLIFANNKKHTYTIANPIDEVLAAFNVTFV